MRKLIFFFFIFCACSLFGQVGVIDESGNIILPFEYEKLNNITGSDCLIAQKRGSYGLIEKDGTDVLPFIYHKIKSNPKKQLIEIYKKDLSSGVVYHGLTDYTGNVIVEPNTYTKLSFFSDKFFYGLIKESDGVIFNQSGKVLKKLTKCDDIHFVSDSIFTTCRGKETFKIDLFAPEVVTQIEGNDERLSMNIYSSIKKIGSNRYAAYKSTKEVHFINEKGEILKEVRSYDRISTFKDGFAIINKDGKTGLLDSIGILAIPVIYEFIRRTTDGNFLVQKDGKQWIVNSQNEILTPSHYNKLRLYLNLKNMPHIPLASFEKGNFYGILKDNYQEIIIETDKEIKDIFFDGLSYKYQIKYTDGSYSLRDRYLKNMVDIPAGLIPASSKLDDRFIVVNSENSKYGLIDKEGKFILPSIFKSLKSFLVEGQYIAKLDDVKLHIEPNDEGRLRF